MDLTTLALGFALAALLLAAYAALRAHVPPQMRVVYDHGARLQDVEHAVLTLSERQTRRTKAENMDGAREAFKQRRAASDAVLAEAQRVLAEKAEPAVSVRDPQAEKAALRLKAGIH